MPACQRLIPCRMVCGRVGLFWPKTLEIDQAKFWQDDSWIICLLALKIDIL